MFNDKFGFINVLGDKFSFNIFVSYLPIEQSLYFHGQGWSYDVIQKRKKK